MLIGSYYARGNWTKCLYRVFAARPAARSPSGSGRSWCTVAGHDELRQFAMPPLLLPSTERVSRCHPAVNECHVRRSAEIFRTVVAAVRSRRLGVLQRRRRFSFAKCCCSCWSTWKMTDCSVEATRPSTFCVLAATAPRLSSERKTELKSITKINSECMRQTLARIYRYSLTYEAISDLICNCCQRLHDFFQFLPVSHQIDIRTAKFLENFMCSKNNICTMLENKADSNLKKIFSVRGNNMSLQFWSSFELVWSVTVIMCFFRFYSCYFIFASCYAATSGE